jgi:hypothetical protein
LHAVLLVAPKYWQSRSAHGCWRQGLAKAFEDPGFVRDFKKLTGSDASPLTGAEVEEAIRKMPRDPEVIALYKKLADSGPLPPR